MSTGRESSLSSHLLGHLRDDRRNRCLVDLYFAVQFITPNRFRQLQLIDIGAR